MKNSNHVFIQLLLHISPCSITSGQAAALSTHSPPDSITGYTTLTPPCYINAPPCFLRANTQKWLTHTRIHSRGCFHRFRRQMSSCSVRCSHTYKGFFFKFSFLPLHGLFLLPRLYRVQAGGIISSVNLASYPPSPTQLLHNSHKNCFSQNLSQLF